MYYSKAAEQGVVDAQNWVGVFYLEGRVIDQNFQTAVTWFRKAADQDDKYAFWNLGRCYENGWGVTQNKVAALEYYEKAAKFDHEDAQKAIERLRTETW